MIASLIALLAFLFPLAYSPGPGNMAFAAAGARSGAASLHAANFGYHLATFTAAMVVGIMLAQVMQVAPHIFPVLKIVGAAYVLWLAWRLYRAGQKSHDETATPENSTASSLSFLDGVLLLALNPKAYMIMVLMFQAFLPRFSGLGPLTGIALVAMVFTLNNYLAFYIWASLGQGLTRLFRTPNSARTLNSLFAALLAGVAVWMLVS